MEQSNPEKIKLLVVTVNYFSASLVAKLLNQLANQPLPDKTTLSVVCFDNSVSHNEKFALERLQANSSIEFKLIISPINLGFGRAINKSVADMTFDYLCCINPDVCLLPDTLSELLAHSATHQDQGIWGGLTVDDQRQPDFRHAWQETTIKNTFAWAVGLNRLIDNQFWQNDYRHMANNTTQTYPVDSVSGCCILISASAWQAVGGFDSNFFLYSEEIDLCLRARQIGFQPTVVPLSKLHHAAHTNKESTRRLKTFYSSKLQYASKHHGLLYNLCYRSLLLLGSLIRMVKSLAGGHLNATRAWATLAGDSLIYHQDKTTPIDND